MATKESRSALKKKADDLRHNCELCMEPYNRSRIPKILPCFHTFCSSCLNALAENAGKPHSGEEEKAKGKVDASKTKVGEAVEEEASEDSMVQETEDAVESTESGKEGLDKKPEAEDDAGGNYGNEFLCPTCRTSVTLPTGGVSALQTNFYLDVDDDSAEELSSTAGSKSCDMCEEGEQNEATHFCNNCQQKICRSCRRLHDRLLREYLVEPISASKAIKGGEGKRFCQYHSDQALSFHCQKCDVSICLHCKLTSHEGHVTEDMATAAIRAKEELTGVLTKASKQLRVMDASLSRLERDELDLARQKQEVTRKLKANNDVIRAWAERAFEEARETLEAREQMALSEIHSEQASARNTKETISGLVARAMASRKASLGPDLVLLKNELQAALLSDDSFARYERLGQRKQPRTFFECRADSTALSLELMRAYVGELLEEEVVGAAKEPSLSLRELAALVPKLEADLKALAAEKRQLENVSFHAQMTVANTYNINQRILFNNVLCNQGNGYNAGNGIFTAPVAGTYIFMTTVKNNSNAGFASAYLYVNGSYYGYTDAPDSSTAHCVAVLNKGSQVWVQVGGSYNIQCRANSTMFSGILVPT